MNQNRRLYIAVALVIGCGCLFLATIIVVGLLRMSRSTPAITPDLLGTLAASTPSGAITAPAITAPAGTGQAVATPTLISSDQPTGKIVFTCQLFKVQASNQVCMMNADGSGFRRLTTDNGRQQLYASLSPDGHSVVYSAFREANVYEIHEINLSDGTAKQLTDRLGVLNAPEISPDGRSIVFTHWTVASDKHSLWLMDRAGSNPHELFNADGAEAWDPTWSPDGTQILFASDMGGSNQLWIVDRDGSDPHRVSNLPALRGRSDWSSQNLIATYSGEPGKREIFVMNVDGSNQHQISPPGGSSQGPSFSPDGRWVAFTSYFDHLDDIHGCELYIIRVNGTDLRRLTNNDYCDYQPRWGP